jgi:hypothetical protein
MVLSPSGPRCSCSGPLAPCCHASPAAPPPKCAGPSPAIRPDRRFFRSHLRRHYDAVATLTLEPVSWSNSS